MFGLRISVSKFQGPKLFTPVLSELKLFQRGIKGSLQRSIHPPAPKPAPYPYKTKSYNKLHSLFDKTSARIDENSKLIVVEGSVAAGKTQFAKELARDLDMCHMPEANLDMLYTNQYGYNFKSADHLLPEEVRFFDVKDFLLNPKHRDSAKFQLTQYLVKYSQYIDALAHLLSTGQGVVLERCAFSDFIFLEAMSKQGYVSREARYAYYEVRKATISQLLRPHLIVYLDVNVDAVLENIKKRNIAVEAQSRVLNPTYLQMLEDLYKQNYLKELSTHSELLVYDWSQGGDMEVVIEDIERLEFKRQDEHDPKLADWSFEFEEDWFAARNLYSDKKSQLMAILNVPVLDAPELLVDASYTKEYTDIYDSTPGNKYHYGYNAAMGDKGLLFKMGVLHRETLPLIERKI